MPGLEIDEVVELADLEPGAIDHMIARGLVPEMPTDATKLHPDLFPSREAAKIAYRRGGLRILLGPDGPNLVTSPYRLPLLDDVPTFPALPFFSTGGPRPAAAFLHS